MKANGRRRWRRRARKWRHKEREYGTYVLRFPPGYRNNLGGYDRRHQHSAAGRYSADGKERKLAADTPPRPFSARSLPGMSQGARKRMALRARQAALSLIAGAGREADPKKLALLRSIYRIGERLRPCPAWVAMRSAKNNTERCGWWLADGTWFDCQNCRGSGVLPARRSR